MVLEQWLPWRRTDRGGYLLSESVVIRFENLSKSFGRGEDRVQAVKRVSLEIQAGQVYGFLGPNGAGKTTTIRMMMNLIRPTEGAVLLFGRNVNQGPETLRRVGALVESPSFYGYLSGWDNLKVLGRTAGVFRPARVGRLLEQVGLSESAHRAVKTYSMGMKQRLGIAASLLSDPDLVILDEPTNGLDPAGIQEIRTLIRDMADQHGKTVFLSSHLLNEVEQVCDRVAIIHRGEVVRAGRVAELLAEGQTELRLQASPLDEAMDVLKGRWPVLRSEDWLTVHARPPESPEVVRLLVANAVDVHQVIVQSQSLEAYFMDVTREERHTAPQQELSDG
jgi:ABC-2 type transport system ATP-binding protein